jgi:hypothetical protein
MPKQTANLQVPVQVTRFDAMEPVVDRTEDNRWIGTQIGERHWFIDLT